MIEVIKHFMSEILVTIPVKIVKIHNDSSLVDVIPIVFNDLEMPIIVSCPFLHIGNKDKYIKINTKIGNVHYAMFSQIDLSNYIAKGSQGQVNSIKKFKMNNAVILPVFANTKVDKFQMPSLDFEIVGDIKITGNINHIGNTTQTGEITATGTIKSDTEVEASGVKLTTHKHGGVTSGMAQTGGPV